MFNGVSGKKSVDCRSSGVQRSLIQCQVYLPYSYSLENDSSLFSSR